MLAKPVKFSHMLVTSSVLIPGWWLWPTLVCLTCPICYGSWFYVHCFLLITFGIWKAARKSVPFPSDGFGQCCCGPRRSGRVPLEVAWRGRAWLSPHAVLSGSNKCVLIIRDRMWMKIHTYAWVFSTCAGLPGPLASKFVLWVIVN